MLVMGVFFPQGVKAQTHEPTELTNLVVFVRFADDAEIDQPMDSVDRLFNSREPGYLSVYNYFDVVTYGQIHFNTVYTNNIQNGVIVSYVDPMPRAYFQPYSDSNLIGYQPEEIPYMGVPMREAQLLGRIVRYVDSLHLVDADVVLDGDGDGDIDNISFIVKGKEDTWDDMLWPHMEFFPHDSLGYISTINGIILNTFNFEFEGSQKYFNAHVFRHELGHSLGLPDLYHYVYYFDVLNAGTWDQMCKASAGGNQISAIYKSKVLHVCDDPIEITTDGDYTLRSVGSSASQNCYYIKSSIDSTQWFTFEYRRKADLFDGGIPGTGLIAGRWSDTIAMDSRNYYSNAFFDFYNVANQYWIFRPGSDIDTVNGGLDNAHFCSSVGRNTEPRTSFGPTTDPHPYLTDGTPETSFEITNIHENGTELTFHVHFFNHAGVTEAPASDIRVYAVDDRIVVEGGHGERVSVFDIVGRPVGDRALSAGVYVVKVGDRPARKVVIVK